MKKYHTENKHKNFFEFYNINMQMDEFASKEKSNVLNGLCFGSEVINELLKAADSTKFVVDIPKDLIGLLKTGQAQFDHSSKVAGNFTPNIRIQGQKGIVGQATIAKQCDPNALCNSLANLSSMAMSLSCADQLQTIEEKVDEIKCKIDSQNIGKIVGSFHDALNAYTSGFQMEQRIGLAASNINIGLTAWLKDINDLWSKLYGGPKSAWTVASYTVRYPFQMRMHYYKETYYDFIQRVQMCYAFIMMYDVVVGCLTGTHSAVIPNHFLLYNILKDRLDDQFIEDVELIDESATETLPILLENSRKMYQTALDFNKKDTLQIECDKHDLERLAC